MRDKLNDAQWVARLTCDRWIPVSREFEPIKGPRCFLEQETVLSLLNVLVGSRNGFERDLHKQIIACFTIELKKFSIN